MVENELQQQLRFSAALNQLAEITLSTEEPTQLLEAMARLAGTTLQVDRSLVYEIRPATNEAVGLAQWLNPGRPRLTSTLGTFPLDLFGDSVAEALHSRGFIESHRDHVHQSIGRRGLALLHGEMEVASLLWFPFGFGSERFHLLIFHQLEPRPWQAVERAFIEAVARQVNLALVKIALTEERKRALQALEASEARYRMLYDATPAMFFTVNEAGKVVSANRFAHEQLGFGAEELIGLDVLEVFVPQDRPTIRRQLEHSSAHEGELFRWEARKTRKDGTVVAVRETARTTRGSTGERHTLIACDDVTEQRRVEQAVLQAQKLETVGVLVSGIAHDFNNLLGIVIGNAELALMGLRGDALTRELVGQTALAAQRAADLVRQLLSYSARAPFSRQQVSLNEVVREMAQLLEVTVGKKARVVLELDPRRPLVLADPTQLRQVVMNMVHNAAEAMVAGEGVVRVRTLVARAPGMQQPASACIEVTDTGRGIDPDALERIFDPFYTTKAAGRGLGLSAVRTIAQRHGGSVFVASTLGLGSTFTLSLPLAQAEGAVVSRDSLPVPPLPAGAAVLVVDDDEGLRAVLGQELEALGLVPLLAARTSAAQQLVHEHPEVRCALVDLTIREGGGVAFVHELHRTRPDLPVLLMSGCTAVDPQAQGEAVGFLAKPFTPLTLGEALGRAQLA